MKITILHQELEWSEITIHDTLIKRGHQATLADIRTADFDDLAASELVLNRVYASVANRDYRDNLKCVQALQALEAQGVPCINSCFTSRVDYSKYFSYQLLAAQDIPTPETIFIKSADDIPLAQHFSGQHGFPLVIKRDMGGRAMDIRRLGDRQAMDTALDYFFGEAYREHYDAGFILQTYHHNSRDFDCRIAVIDQHYVYAYRRSLISNSDAEPDWIGSQSRGSVSGCYSPGTGEIELAVRSTETIQSMFNEVDMIFSEAGPMVIENNPTPVFFAGKDEERLEAVVERILASVVS